MIRDVILAAATVALCSADLTYDPHVAVLLWSDGYREDVPTINGSQCQCAREKLKRVGTKLITAYCDYRDGFAPGWDKIKGYNR